MSVVVRVLPACEPRPPDKHASRDTPPEVGLRGPPGDDGPQGIAGKRGAQGPTGPRGATGAIGPMPRHEWRNTELRFEMAPGEWGKFVDLRGPAGQPGGGGGIVSVVQSLGGGGSVPYYVPAGEVFAVAVYQQALFARTIEVDGIVDLDGDLIGVE